MFSYIVAHFIEKGNGVSKGKSSAFALLSLSKKSPATNVIARRPEADVAISSNLVGNVVFL